MTSFTDKAGNVISNAGSTVVDDANAAQNFLNQNNPLTNKPTDGFTVPSTYSADGNGLPYTKVPSGRPAQAVRNIISWFVPQFGLVRMYVNPENIVFSDSKLITPERTKGGYTLQYWGENLTDINISGTTGSSGIEGINMLYEVYRAEQYAFDSVGLTLDANNYNNDLSHNLINGIASSFSGNQVTQAGISGLIGGVLGVDSPNNTLSAKNIPSLAQLAFTVEMYYSGWVYRGFFTSFVLTESTSHLMNYQMKFMATQKRGYRTNMFPWERSPKYGPSDYTTPTSY